MIIDTQCIHCKHFRDKDKTGNKCDAFPDGIPEEIWFNKHDHIKPYKGDKGIQFEEENPAGK